MAIASRGARMAVDWEQRVDFDRLRRYRLGRAKATLAACAGTVAIALATPAARLGTLAIALAPFHPSAREQARRRRMSPVTG